MASRTPGKAEAFAKEFGIESHDNYEDLLARDDINVIYIPTLPTQHHAHALQAIAAGKHVLIEKPITMDAAQAEEIFAAARAKGVFAMEAMWTRYLPQYDIARQLIENKTLGEIQVINATFCTDNRDQPRLWAKGGGNPIIDMGIYSISFLQSFLGEPTEITAQAVLTQDKIDKEVSVQLRYASGARGYILSSAVATLPVTATVAGDKGHMTMGPAFPVPSQITISDNQFYFETETWHDQGPAVGHNGLGVASRELFISVLVEDVAQFVLAVGCYDVGSSDAFGLVHTHVQRCGLSVSKSTLCLVELHGRNTEVKKEPMYLRNVEC